jgi:hypothetical protein
MEGSNMEEDYGVVQEREEFVWSLHNWYQEFVRELK